MDTKSTDNNTQKNNGKAGNKIPKWLIWLILVPVVAAGLFMLRYPFLEKRSSQNYERPLESQEFIERLYNSNYVLYKDLYEKTTGMEEDYWDLYLDFTVNDSYKEVEDEIRSRAMEYKIIYEINAESGDESVSGNNLPEMEKEQYLKQACELMKLEYEDLFSGWETFFKELAQLMEYSIIDNSSQTSVTNTSMNMENPEDFYLYFRVSYDENGMISDLNVKGENTDAFFKRAAEIGREKRLDEERLERLSRSYRLDIKQKGPINCTVSYGITEENFNAAMNNEMDGNDYSWQFVSDYYYSGIDSWFTLFVIIIALLIFLLPQEGASPWKLRFFQQPLEIIILIGMIVMAMRSDLYLSVGNLLETNTQEYMQQHWGVSPNLGIVLAYGSHFLYLLVMFFLISYVVLNFRAVREYGVRGYIKKSCYIYRFFPFMKRKITGAYHYLMSFDISTSTNKIIIKILIVNGVAVTIISFFWISGFLVIFIYSGVLYFLLRKYINDLKKKYEVLLDATNKIADGNLNVTIKENLGVFEPFKSQITKIQEGFRTAVEDEVKSQRMKTELITNVSHDLKTPLTAIITYVDLLKDENLSAEKRTEYLQTLERKSQRLKVLIEDLFEVSKATSKNVTLNYMDVDLINLIKQTQLEQEEKLAAVKLTVKMKVPEEKVILRLDSQKTFRIYENLIGNIAKYALPETRVYIDVEDEENFVRVVFKNISASEILVNPMELTERFVRGDSARSTEGSGLGLAIAKSFVELQNGKMEIEIDGDLFKVTTIWYK